MIKVHTVETGALKLDGGAMFGIVPQRIWRHLNPPDAHNMCTWSMRCLILETDTRKILIDTGIGTKQDSKFISFFEPTGQDQFLPNLEIIGVRPEDITDVLLTHLHFDHVGGALSLDASGQPAPTFPNARYWTNQQHYRWAMEPNAREAASFLKENFVPLQEMGKWSFIEPSAQGEVDWLDGIRLRFLNGHTEAMMMPIIPTESHTLVYCADLIPSSYHIGLPYIMSYDVRPLLTLEEKERLLLEAVERDYILVFEHDPVVEAAKIQRSPSGKLVLGESGKLQDLV